MNLTNPFNLTARTAFISGSSRGIGRAIAFALGCAGARVIFHGVAESAAMEKTLAEADEQNIAHDIIYGDLGDASATQKIADALTHIDILVLNASTQTYMTLENFDVATYEKIADTNLRSSFMLVSALAPKMAARNWGRIISIGSVNQSSPAPRLCAYAATKAAQHNLILTCAKTYAASGVTANTISPGVIRTDRNAAALSDPAFAETLRTAIPANRFGAPEDCAGIALALASDACAYITGADIPVDGGMLI